MDGTKRIAMWSGPRNISTAMMRAFENRSDSMVIDEPLYAAWLRATGTLHPGADEVMRVHQTDWRRVVADLLGPVPAGVEVFYQKHMAHHLLPEMDRDWIDRLTNVFLIREPEEMLCSLIKVRAEPTLEETGLPQQLELHQRLRRAGQEPPVIDARDVLTRPEATLRRLCALLDITFEHAMLAWPAGRRASDGVWARHWYDAVERSTGFLPWRARDERVPEAMRPLLRACREIHAELHARRLRPEEA